MKLSIELNQEEQDAWQDRVDLYNQSAKTSLTVEQFIEQVILADETAKLVKQKFDASATRITEATRSIPYANRLALIAQIEASIPA